MKIRALVIAAAMLFSVAMIGGCSDKSGNEGAKNNESAPTQSSAAVEDQSSQEESSPDSEVSAESSQETPGTPVDASWFDDAVFVGDSVTLKLSYYAEEGALGSTEFLCAGSLGWSNALWDIDAEDNVHPIYDGEKYTVDEGLKMLGAKKIIIMLGMNDIGLYGVDEAAENMQKLMDRIVEKNPDAEIYIQSVTPMLENMQLSDLNNTTIAQFDEKLVEICAERGYKYLNVAEAVDDGNGNLVPEYCGDPDAMGLHFSDEGCERWVEYLKNHVND